MKNILAPIIIFFITLINYNSLVSKDVQNNIKYNSNKVIQNNQFIHIIGSERQIKIEFCKKYIAKITTAYSTDTLSNIQYAININPKADLFSYKELNDKYIINSDSIIIYIDKSNLSTSIIDNINNDTLITDILYSTPNNYKGFRSQVDTSLALYGVGSQAIEYNKRDHNTIIYNSAEYKYEYPGNWAHIATPIYNWGNKFCIIVDNPSKGYSASYRDNSNFHFFADDIIPTFYVINIKGQTKIINEINEISGYQPLPPLWVLGFLQFRIFSSDIEMKEVADEFKKHKIPLDAVATDYNWFGAGEGLGNFNWANNERWENADSIMQVLDKDNIKKMLITEPFFSKGTANYQYALENKFFVLNKDSTPFETKIFHNYTSLIDITNPKALEWFIKLHDIRTIKNNLTAWWLDLGEPDAGDENTLNFSGKAVNNHNLYNNNWLKALINSLNKINPNVRNILFSRSGWIGMPKYSAIPWTGDCANNFNALSIQPDMILSLGVCGIGYLHSDIGGYDGRFEPDPITYVRWLQFGAFSPIMRAHSNNIIPPMPYIYDDSTVAINRKFIELRYALLPYIYTLSYENSTKGFPLCRAMNFYDYSDEIFDINDKNNTSNIDRFKNVSKQFYFGRDMLIAPIFDSTNFKKVLFPNGDWINYFTLDKYKGNSDTTVYHPLSEMPLYVRAGAIIPNCKKIMNTANYSTDTLIFNYYYDKDVESYNSYCYIDDGINPNSLKNNQFEILNFMAENKDSTIKISVNRNCHNWTDSIEKRVYIFNILCKDTINGKVTFNTIDSTFNTNRTINSTGGMKFISYPISGDFSVTIQKHNNHSKIDDTINNSDDINFNKLNIFPNPVKDEINFQISETIINHISLSIFDINGKAIIDYNESDFLYSGSALHCNLKGKYNINPLASGTYFAKLTINGKSYQFTFIKE